MSTTTTVVDRALVAPEQAGIDPGRLDLLLRRIRLEVDNGLVPSMQVAVARHGKLVASECYGDTTPERRYILQSVGRTVVAGIVWQLIGDGLLDPNDKVADLIPEFAANGKDAVTVEHVLTHTGGFPYAPLGYPKMLEREDRLAAFAKWRLDYPSGTKLQFHLTSAAWVIAELVERCTGMNVRDYLRTRIAEPLDLSLELGVTTEDHARTVAPMIQTSDDINAPRDPWGPWFLADPSMLAAGEPSHSMVGTATDLVRYFQAVHHSGLWDADTVADAVRPRVTMVPEGDQNYGGGTRRTSVGLFVTLTGLDAGTWMPATGSPSTWGHGGAAYQLGFHDPETDISFAMLCNGYPPAGYDYTRRGTSFITTVGSLAGDLT
ncbi:serine hydrolase domain-containing protein [Rhodococcus koreensis]|uniref:serine hydrolase domain-containing protein n=1 Tax=Rhodococcus koreensis TaxID=99653 RepID=UPI0036727B37